MSAQGVGEEILGEIKEESLDSLLRSLQQRFSPSPSQLGIPAVDRLIAVFQTPAIPRPPLHHTQWSTQTSYTPTPQVSKDKPPLVIEITGAAACSGKTHLLYYVIAITLLSKTHNDVALNGKESAVLLFDLASKVSISRLRDIMHAYITSRLAASPRTWDDADIADLMQTSLSHLHVFRPHSTPSFLATLSAVADYLLAQPSPHFSANRPLGLLAISEIATFFQQDRSESEEAEVATTVKPTTSLLQTRYESLTITLQKLQVLFSAPIVATNRALNTPTNMSTNQPSLRPHLPGAWNSFCTLQLTVQRDQVTRFGPGMSAEEATAEKEQRWHAVQRSGFSGWINWFGSGGWREEVKAGLRGLDMGGRFCFRLTGDGGVLIDEGMDD